MSTLVEPATLHEAAPPACAPAEAGWETRFHLLMAAVALAVVAISTVGWHFGNLTLSVWQALPTLGLLAALAAGAAQYRWRGERKCFQVVMMVLWIVLVTNAHFFPMYMAARSDVPLNDALLAQADRMLGIEVPQVRAALAPYPLVSRAMLEIYLLLIPLMTVAAILPPMMNRMDKAKEFVVGCIVAASVSLPIFACLQAVGPWHHYEFDPPIASLGGKAAMLAALKTNSLFVIDVTNRDGLITFPSFHVVLTVLAAAALWPFRWLRWPAVLLAMLIVMSTVATGIHYSIDVVGGLLVATLAIAAARGYVLWEAKLVAAEQPAASVTRPAGAAQ